MKPIRRLHMYFGLVLTPFVLLYGVTALLFNHPGLFGPGYAAPESDVFAGVEVPTVESIADEAFELLQLATEGEIHLVERFEPRLVGDFLVDATGESHRSRYRVHPETMATLVRTTPTAPERATPFPDQIDAPDSGFAGEIIVRVSEHADGAQTRARIVPDVEFQVTADGEDWVVLCDLHTGTVNARPAGEPTRALDVRSFLLRLHVSHGYPMSMSARWLWAVVVDIMAALMIFWALSGVLMWWQLKPARRTGGAVGAAGIVLAIVLGYAMLKLMYY